MVDNEAAFFYLGKSSSEACTPQMLDNLPTRSREIILTNMRQSTSLILRILESLYPQANMTTAGEGFVATCSDEEALKLIEDSTVMVGQVVDMLGIDMSLK
jgi:hypothetical protein